MLRYAFMNNREVNQAFNTTDLVDSSSRGSSFTSDNALIGGLTSVLNAQSNPRTSVFLRPYCRRIHDDLRSGGYRPCGVPLGIEIDHRYPMKVVSIWKDI